MVTTRRNFFFWIKWWNEGRNSEQISRFKWIPLGNNKNFCDRLYRRANRWRLINHSLWSVVVKGSGRDPRLRRSCSIRAVATRSRRSCRSIRRHLCESRRRSWAECTVRCLRSRIFALRASWIKITRNQSGTPFPMDVDAGLTSEDSDSIVATCMCVSLHFNQHFSNRFDNFIFNLSNFICTSILLITR